MVIQTYHRRPDPIIDLPFRRHRTLRIRLVDRDRLQGSCCVDEASIVEACGGKEQVEQVGEVTQVYKGWGERGGVGEEEVTAAQGGFGDRGSGSSRSDEF